MGGRGASSMTRGGVTANSSATVYENALKSAENISSSALRNLENDNISSHIPQWILQKNGVEVRGHTYSVERETDKAILVNNNAGMYGGRDKKFWVPKSQLQPVEKTRKEILEKTANQIISQKYTSYLKQLASTNNVKLGNVSSWDKITAKLKKMGVTVMSRDEYKLSKD